MSDFLLTNKNKSNQPVFECPNCGHDTSHIIESLRQNSSVDFLTDSPCFIFFICSCLSCSGVSYILNKYQTTTQTINDDEVLWQFNGSAPRIFAEEASSPVYKHLIDQRVIEPEVTFGFPQPNADLSEAVKKLYLEANSIANKSPRAAAALFRVTLETFLKEDLHLYDSENKTNYQMIKKLYQENIPRSLGTALNYVRIVGNQADHVNNTPMPGVIDFNGDDGIQTVKTLGTIINILCTRFITEENDLLSLEAIFTPEQKNSIDKMNSK